MSASNPGIGTIWIEPDDAPELMGGFFERADEDVRETLIRGGRPKAESRKLALTIRYDADVVAAFEATGRG